MKQLTKKNIEDILDKKLPEYQSVILSAMNHKFSAVEKRMDKMEATLNKLITTLNGFLKWLTDYDKEFTILKAEVTQIKSILKNNFGIEISLQNPPVSNRK